MTIKREVAEATTGETLYESIKGIYMIPPPTPTIAAHVPPINETLAMKIEVSGLQSISPF